MLNFLIQIIVITCYGYIIEVLVLRKYILKCLGTRRHDACNLLKRIRKNNINKWQMGQMLATMNVDKGYIGVPHSICEVLLYV